MPEPLPARGDRLRVYAVLLLTMAVMGLLFHATQASLPKVFDLRLRDLAGEGALGIGALVALVYTAGGLRSEEHTSELQSLMRISYAVFCLKKKTTPHPPPHPLTPPPTPHTPPTSTPP